ncbi:thiolase family protein [Bacillus sp. ISL-18]|uniref:thiolase family protein n=1 Tax=Bacillus sp. ISL-18 TaxID=2819118 RepID=UPI001BE85C18|nr:thiolase family protein [Bacillus sp. ISL-18]MBT2655949.1 thiolase family protein [Bacillus sp. ISL-18]
MSIRGKAAIVGFGETPFTKDSGKTIFELASEASILAIRDAELTITDIDGIVTLSPLSTAARLNNTLANYLGIKPTYSDEVSVYGASGGYGLKQAAEAVASGAARNVLVVGADLNFLKHHSAEPHDLNDNFNSLYFGGGATTNYAMVTNLYEHLYGDTQLQRAKIAVHQRYNANHNDNALFGHKELTIEAVLNSPVISTPLHLFEIVSPCDGAVAFVVSKGEEAKSISNTPVYIEGAGFHSTHFLLSDADLLRNGVVTPIKKASSIAFEMAGVTVDNIDICGFYDCYTIAVLLTIEDMGFCKKGEGARFIEEHDLTFKGDFPVNTSGGQLSAGQPGDAGGMVNVVEVVRQLMGKAGVRQVPNLEVGVTNTNGGLFSNECTLVLRRG